MENIELSEMLGQLREDLLKARAKSEGSDLKFQIEDIEIELQIVATKGGKGGGGVKFWVYNAEAEANASQAKTQKLKLKLPSESPVQAKPISTRLLRLPSLRMRDTLIRPISARLRT